MSKKPKLSDNKMVRLVTSLFKKESLSCSEDGKVELTADEEAKIKATYGENFLKLFKESEFSADENATQLFDAAVEFKTNQALAEKETLIKDLQKTIVELSQEPEPKPQATQVQNNGAQKTKSFQINRGASYNKAVIAALATTNPMAVDMAETASGIDIADIKAEFKTAMPDGLKLEILTKRIYQGFADSQHMTRRHTRGKNYIATGAIMSEVSQQFTNKWTPKGTYFPEITARMPQLPASEYNLGVLSSPELSGGCGILTIKWARSVLANGNQLLVEIKNTEGSVLKSETYVKEDSEQHVMNETTFNMNVAGTFKIVISNQNYVANDSADGIIQADDINVLGVTWTGYSE